MKRFPYVLIIAMGVAFGILLSGCVPSCPEPDPIEERLYPILYGVFVEETRIPMAEYMELPPWEHPWTSELTIEIQSDEEVQISYERDGQQVVEVYEVSGSSHSEY